MSKVPLYSPDYSRQAVWGRHSYCVLCYRHALLQGCLAHKKLRPPRTLQ